ncbi:hypothetical protein [Bifidobacterium myosotis]|uniref:Uncharacterized protein n=1 Tax=Bifidobacterium myosotis TaxID=1630166 RepID=A0A5M9ZLW8_9BIFI|nr:hypothetical protein [Bifidobacterium myosotis]KAA8828591.1 hypothetical protein EMO91_05520 [Bifidobacterium myosotis]
MRVTSNAPIADAANSIRDLDNESITVSGECFDPNETGYVLRAVTDYLIETAYGLHRLTVTRDAIGTARCLALCVYATHIRPASIAFSAANGDLPALRMMQAALLLCADARMTLITGPFPSVGHAFIRTGTVDTAIGDLLERGLLPTRARGDLYAMKHRISASAARFHRNHGSGIEGGNRNENMLALIASDAGEPWRETAAALAGEWKVAA